MRGLLLILIAIHLACAGVLTAVIASGPPMGESQMSSWDDLAVASFFMTVVVLPAIYVALWKSCNRRIEGPCPKCSHYLIGIPQGICPKCGAAVRWID